MGEVFVRGTNTGQIERFSVRPRRYHTRLSSYMFYRTQTKSARLDLCGLKYVRAHEKRAPVSVRPGHAEASRLKNGGEMNNSRSYAGKIHLYRGQIFAQVARSFLVG